jgi:hypothetical protein
LGTVITSAAQLRGRLNDITFKAKFRGISHRGAEGLPGPFRQALTEISSDIRMMAEQRYKKSVFIYTPNYYNQTGLDRNMLIVNSDVSSVPTSECYFFGQLMGIAIRSQCVLDLDLSPVFWKTLLHVPCNMQDLSIIDYTTYKMLEFRNPVTHEGYSVDEYNDSYDTLTWSTVLSDGDSSVELRPHGKQRRVKYADRYDYAAAVVKARFSESCIQMNNIRAGLYSIIPSNALTLLTHHELAERVCGNVNIDLAVLRRHTVYAPKKYSDAHPYIVTFWSVLSSFSADECKMFLTFCWARNRLPVDSGTSTATSHTWRLKVNINESSKADDLPTSETCFFNLNIPLYPTVEQLHGKLLFAVTNCSSITS